MKHTDFSNNFELTYKKLKAAITFLNAADSNFEAAAVLYTKSKEQERMLLLGEYPGGKLGEALIEAAQQYNRLYPESNAFYGGKFNITDWRTDKINLNTAMATAYAGV